MMRGRPLLAAAVAAIALAAAAWWLLDARHADGGRADTLLLPGFAARAGAIDRIEVVGAGDEALVTLEKRDGTWRMPARGDWPGNGRAIADALHRLGEAKRLEAKTADPAKHARLAVEDVTAPAAKGTELRLSGGGEPVVLTVGQNHPALGGSYLRVGDDPQAWLVDVDVAPARDPAVWLDRRLVDIPLARIERVRVAPAAGGAFVLSRVDDAFVPDAIGAGAAADPDAGNATAGVPDQLPLEDVAPDDESAATHTVVFETVDGVALTIASWPGERGTWARLDATLDEAKARAWFDAEADGDPADGDPADGDPADGDATGGDATDGDATDGDAAGGDAAARLDALRAQVADWQARFAGRRFLIPAYKAQPLTNARAAYLRRAG